MLHFAAADVVGGSVAAGGRDEAVGPNDIANVGEVAFGTEVTVGHFAAAGELGPGDLARDGWREEIGRLAWTDVIEWPHDNDVEAPTTVVLLGECFGCLFAGSVRGPWLDWCGLGEWK